MTAVPIATPPPDPRAEDIFARTRAAFAAREFPSTIKYAARVSGFRDGKWTSRTYDAIEHWPDERVFTHAISEEETADPVKPPPFCFFGIGAPKKSGLDLPGILGVPHLAVTYDFGLSFKRGGEPLAPGAGELPTIGTVHSYSRTYDVRIAAEETVDGAACWHLVLRPLGNPGKYRLRDLWVDESSYQTRRLVTDGNFTGKSTGSGAWTVSYEQRGDAWFLASEISRNPVSGWDGKRYDHVAVQFVDPTADPHENLDFGIAGVNPDEPDLAEP